MEEIKFDKGIPIPPNAQRTKYLWANMEVGDSKYIEPASKADSIAATIRKYIKQQNLTWKIIVRKEKNGKRIWRVE
jgi:hypothetical protein